MLKNKKTLIIKKIPLELLLVVLYLFLKPFYFWSSGLPQISDFIGILLIGYSFIFLLNKEKKNKIIYVLTAVLLLFVYIFIVNSIWGILLNEHIIFSLSSTWYLYNFLIFVSIWLIYRKNNVNFIKLSLATISITLYLQFLLLILMPSGDIRGTGFFNNPNQLGYFALLYFSLYVLLSRKKHVNGFLFWTTGISALVISFISLSKAAIVALIVLLVLELLLNNIDKKKNYFVKILVVISGMFILMLNNNLLNSLSNHTLLSSVSRRLNSIGADSDDNLAGRGYDRIFNHKDYLLFGAGEGKYERFQSFGGEMHSTLGSFFFSYGIIGFTLLTFLLLACFYRNKLINVYPFFIILLYGFTHNGIRNTILWFILAIILAYKQEIALANLKRKKGLEII